MKKEVITAFISRYHVTPQQAAVLRRSDQVDTEFFTVLERVQTIHQDCKILLQTHQTTGLQIMENMAHLQEQAFQTLFKWTQVTFALEFSYVSNAGNLPRIKVVFFFLWISLIIILDDPSVKLIAHSPERMSAPHKRYTRALSFS